MQLGAGVRVLRDLRNSGDGRSDEVRIVFLRNSPSTYFAIDQVELLDLIHVEAKANVVEAIGIPTDVERGECP
jgi:hypothetical protein